MYNKDNNIPLTSYTVIMKIKLEYINKSSKTISETKLELHTHLFNVKESQVSAQDDFSHRNIDIFCGCLKRTTIMANICPLPISYIDLLNGLSYL